MGKRSRIKYKHKDEYLRDHPERAWLWSLPRVSDPSGKNKNIKGIMLKCEDPMHEGPNPKRFVVLGNLAQDPIGDGLYHCKVCAQRYITERSSKGKEDLGFYTSDKYKNGRKKAVDTLKDKGYYNSDEFKKCMDAGHTPEVQAKAAKTNREQGTFMRSKLELEIDRLYGTIHLQAGEKDPLTGERFKYELDCFWPFEEYGGWRYAIEVDDKTHANKSIMYHTQKRHYFEERKIRILHITLNPEAKRRLNYNNLDELITEFKYGRLPRNLEIMWDDKYYQYK